MKEQLKKIDVSSIIMIIKAGLIGVVVSILLVLGFAFVLKFVDLSSTTISLVDQIIKIISIMVSIIMLSQVNGKHLLLKSIVCGGVYSVITFLVFSILNGGINLTMAIFSDVVFSSLVGGVCAILLNMIIKK